MGLSFDNPHVETGDRFSAFTEWRFVGVNENFRRTDRGRLYASFDSGANQTTLFTDAGKTQAVCQGPDLGVEADLTLAAVNNSGITAFVHRRAVEVGDVVVWIWITSEQDLIEYDDEIEGLLLQGETNFGNMLRSTMREFLTRIAADYQPPPSVGSPLRYSPSTTEQGRRGAPERISEFLWTLNAKGEFELTGLQNPGDYREWAINQTLAKIYNRKARAGDPTDPVWSRQLAFQREADRLWKWVKAWIDHDQNNSPDRPLRVRTTRIRRG